MSISKIQACARGWLVRHIKSERFYGQTKWFSSAQSSEFYNLYNEFIDEALSGRVQFFTGHGLTPYLNAGTVVQLLKNSCLLFQHSHMSQVLRVTVVRPCEREERHIFEDFGKTPLGCKRIRPLPGSELKGLSSDVQAHIASFMNFRDYWAFSLVSRNVYFDGRGIVPQMKRLAARRIGHQTNHLEKALRGYTCLRQSVPCPWRTIFLASVTTKIVGIWPVQSERNNCVGFVTADGRIGSTDIDHGITQHRRTFQPVHNAVVSVARCPTGVVLCREWGFSVQLPDPNRRWCTVRVPNVHEVAIVDCSSVYYVAGSSRELWRYDVGTNTCLQLPHSRVQMLKRTVLGIICRTATKQLTYHSLSHVGGINGGLMWTLTGVGRIAMISDPLPSGCNVVIRARRGVAFQAVVLREALTERVVDIDWTPWFRRELQIVGDMLTFHDHETRRRACVRPDSGEWVPKDMCVGTTDGSILFCKDTTVFAPNGGSICVLPRWA